MSQQKLTLFSFPQTGLHIQEGEFPCDKVNDDENVHKGKNFQNIKLFFFFNFIFKLYIIVLVLPNIKMNPPQVYMCSPS